MNARRIRTSSRYPFFAVAPAMPIAPVLAVATPVTVRVITDIAVVHGAAP
jgi:hypothetical protein